MAKEYELTQFKVGDFQDNHGNTWCDAVFLGVGEPVRIVVKDPTKYEAGQKLYGELKEQTSKAGKPYLRFYREQRPEGQTSFTPSAKKEWTPRDDSHIRAQWAIGQAVSLAVATHKFGLEDVESDAKWLYAMVDRVKESTPVTASTNPGTTQTFSNGEPLPDQVYEPTEAPINLSDIPF